MPVILFITICGKMYHFECHFEWTILSPLKMCQFHNVDQIHRSTVESVTKFEQIPDFDHLHISQICQARCCTMIMMTMNRVKIKCHFKDHRFRKIVVDFVTEIMRGKSIDHNNDNKWLALVENKEKHKSTHFHKENKATTNKTKQKSIQTPLVNTRSSFCYQNLWYDETHKQWITIQRSQPNVIVVVSTFSSAELMNIK